MTTEPQVGEAAAAPIALSPALERARLYAETRSVVLPELKVLYLPVPKAGCTSMLWLLAELGELDLERFARSTTREVTLPMTVHDLWMWGQKGLRLSDLSDEQRSEAFASDEWFRFSIVREPASRLWSAWQSKLLMREPRFVETFGDAPWFPALPDESAPKHVLTAFRDFVAAIAADWDDEAMRDPHWTPQWDIVKNIPLTHLGRLERLGETLTALREHVGDRFDVDKGLPRENRTPIRYDPVVYDAATAAYVNALYAEDFELLDYTPAAAVDDDKAREEWLSSITSAFPVVQEVAARHERLSAMAEVLHDRIDQSRGRKQEIAKLRRQVDRLKTTAEKVAKAHETEIEERDKSIAELHDNVAAVTAERDVANETIAGMLASKSWRLTRPLRRLSRTARRG